MTSGIVYDWAKRQGHYYWMKKAKEMGCEILSGFHNSPLVCWTLSGTANTAAPGSTLNPSNGRWAPTVGNMQGNLQTDKYGDYAAYLADVLEHFATDTFNDKYGRPASMRFNYISPLNEPQYDWNEIRQEGTPWSNENIAKLTREINSAIMDASRPNINDTNTKIMIPESGHWDHAYASAGSGHYANNQLENFFDKTYQGGTNYVGDLPTMKPNFLAGHTYWTHDNDTQMINHRKNLATVAERLGVAIWNTEWSVLTNGTGLAFYNGSTHWECAIFMGKLIHTDLTVANMQSWSFWTSVDQEWGNTNYYSLVGVSPGSIDKFDPMSTEFLETGYGNVKSQSTLWVLGHWSLFVRPGFVRIDISGSSTATARNIVAGNLQGLMASAYKSPPGFKDVNGEDVDRIVVVYVNNGRASREVKAEFKDGREPKLVRCFYTNESNTNSLENEGKQGMRNRTHLNGVYIIPAKSVLTAVYDF
jgi:O-glycosyl hydrolase